jgi:hypothetical protein
MPRQSWTGLLVSQQADGTALNTSTTETSILSGQAKYTVPANFLSDVGQTLRIRAMGRISNIVTSPGTLTLRVKMGPTSTIIAATSGALALNIVAKTNVTWILDWDLTVRSVGSSTAATFMHSGSWQSESVIGSPAAGAGGASAHIIPASAPAVGTGFDSTVANVLDLTAQWSTSNAANSIQVHSFKLESLN